MDRSLLMTDQNLMKSGRVKFVEERQDYPSRVIEDRFDPFFFQTLDNDLCSGFLHTIF
jgi:hypothetical protein